MRISSLFFAICHCCHEESQDLVKRLHKQSSAITALFLICFTSSQERTCSEYNIENDKCPEQPSVSFSFFSRCPIISSTNGNAVGPPLPVCYESAFNWKPHFQQWHRSGAPRHAGLSEGECAFLEDARLTKKTPQFLVRHALTCGFLCSLSPSVVSDISSSCALFSSSSLGFFCAADSSQTPNMQLGWK